jgi:hypothetical protein
MARFTNSVAEVPIVKSGPDGEWLTQAGFRPAKVGKSVALIIVVATSAALTLAFGTR